MVFNSQGPTHFFVSWIVFPWLYIGPCKHVFHTGWVTIINLFLYSRVLLLLKFLHQYRRRCNPLSNMFFKIFWYLLVLFKFEVTVVTLNISNFKILLNIIINPLFYLLQPIWYIQWTFVSWSYAPTTFGDISIEFFLIFDHLLINKPFRL